MLNLALAVFIYAAIEYIVHRWDMHLPGSYRFKSHTIEHHGQGHMGLEQASLTQENVGIAFWYSFAPALIINYFSPGFLMVWAAMLFWAGFTWTAVHRNIHGEPGYWYAYILCPWLPLVKWNHLRHHDNPKRSYGGMFFFISDTLMGTL